MVYLYKERKNKLSDETIREIIKLRKGGETILNLARKFGVNRGTIQWYTDANFREKTRERNREFYRRYKNDATFLKEQRERKRLAYLKRKQELEQLSPEEKAQVITRQLERALSKTGNKKFAEERIEKIMKGGK